ncbi:MAG TPA: hypothetical protein VFG42_02885 [Baekduia sp.]|uniref:hypothetical protein n=1 Tax=Baekduia sp. TaxID=2600305 RepID=UPI002D79E609|nr:hypothetical protein [Baekduia sp.]HET6505713.1 hypothetical protein [Baekduia sp.]
MTATLTLFRPSILDPVEDADRTQLREPGFVHDRSRRSAPGDGEQPQLREPGSARIAAPAPATVPDATPAPTRDDTHQPMVQQDGGPTLDELLVGVWEGLAAHRTVACPACGEAMTPRYSAGPAPVGGRCGSCRTTIA